MKKSSFVALVLGTVSGVLFSLGMCMALLPEWNAFWEGVIFGGVGLLLGLITFLIWCKMEHKKLPQMSEEEQLRLLSTDGMLVKRPIVVKGDLVLTGFKEADWEKLK